MNPCSSSSANGTAEGGGAEIHTFDNPEDIQITVVGCHAAGRERVFAVAKEILPDLGVAECFHVLFVAVDATAGFVDADHVDGFFGGTVGEFAGEVGVETFGAEGYEDVDCKLLAWSSESED